jgi:hypothetical protein
MEELFRLMLQRPAIAQDDTNPSIDLTQDSPYQNAVRDALASGEPGTRLAEVSRAYVASAEFLGAPADNPYAESLAALDRELTTLQPVTPAKVRTAVKTAFGASAGPLAKSTAFKSVLGRLRDSIMAIKAVQEEHGRNIEDLIGQLRLMELVARAAADSAFPADEEVLGNALRRTVQLPGRVALTPVTSTRDRVAKQREELAAQQAAREEEVSTLAQRHGELKAALAELGGIRPEHVVSDVSEESAALLPPEELQPLNAAVARAGFVESLRAVQLKAVQPRDGGVHELVTLGADASLLSAPVLQTGREAFVPRTAAFTLQKEAGAALSKGTTALLKERGLDPTSTPLDAVTGHLESELAGVSRSLQLLAAPAEVTSLKRMGGTVVAITEVKLGSWVDDAVKGVFHVTPLDDRIPHTRGDVRPSGIADLIVVRQQLVGYEGADVAHIENVLKGEHKNREHVLHDQTVTTVTQETEVTTEDDHELASTSRFEMSKESEQTIKEDVQLKAGLKVSGKYGPVVEFSASAEGSYQRTKEEATKSASKFSQEVTEKTSKKLTQRIKQTTTTTVTHETTETNTHGIDNAAGTGHISGVYQWVNKVNQAQMFNYGLRALFDFMVPEPAAFLIATMNNAHSSALTVTKPTPFTITPDQISESNYGYYVTQYGATDVAAPPELYKTAAANYQGGPGENADVSFVSSGQITIDAGYRAIWASVETTGNVWEAGASTDVLLGGRSHRFENNASWLWSTSLDSEQGTIPWGVKTWKRANVVVAIEVKCQRTDRALQQWRLETHAKLTTAYKARLQEYEEKLAQLELQAGVAITGKNPAANQATIAAELKKNCISIITDQQFDLFDAIDLDPMTYLPEIDVNEAAGEGPYVRFFEQAFEWEHMQWVTYPYFWGRKGQWDERLGYDDSDPAFADFLKAGYARVTVPARPGFETAIDHFLTFGELWNGGPLPAVSNPLYLPIADELAARLGRPGVEVPQGDPWKVLVPTELVHLRADDKLPVWHQDATGAWVEA